MTLIYNFGNSIKIKKKRSIIYNKCFIFFSKLNKLQKFVFNNLFLLLQSCLGKNEMKKK